MADHLQSISAPLRLLHGWSHSSILINQQLLYGTHHELAEVQAERLVTAHSIKLVYLKRGRSTALVQSFNTFKNYYSAAVTTIICRPSAIEN